MKETNEIGKAICFCVLGRRLGGEKATSKWQTPPAFMIVVVSVHASGKWFWAERKSVCCTEYHSTFSPSHAFLLTVDLL